MITIIVGTNRKNSATFKVAKAYGEQLELAQISHQFLDLSDLPKDFIFSALYGEKHEEFDQLLADKIFSSTGLVIVSPEYNGSYPGILKAFIDGWSPKLLKGQSVGLVGVASGRQGNARGMDHLTNVLNYLELHVIPFKIPISKVNDVLDANGKMIQQETINAIKKQIGLLK